MSPKMPPVGGKKESEWRAFERDRNRGGSGLCGNYIADEQLWKSGRRTKLFHLQEVRQNSNRLGRTVPQWLALPLAALHPASWILNPGAAAATTEAKSEEWKDDGDGRQMWRERARRGGVEEGQMGPSGWSGLGFGRPTDSSGLCRLGWHKCAHGKRQKVSCQEPGLPYPKGKWLVGGAMGQVGGGWWAEWNVRRVVCYRYPTANRANRGRRTLFPENVLENMNIISRKRKLQHLQGSDNARIRAAGVAWQGAEAGAGQEFGWQETTEQEAAEDTKHFVDMDVNVDLDGFD